MECNQGIYKILNIKNGKIYIGSSNNIRKRKNHHYSCLRNGTHGNKYLQKSWDKHGEESFCFSVIECVDESANLILRENYWMNTFKSFNRESGYNIVTFNEEQKRIYTVSKETGDKISVSKKGIKFTESHKKSLSEAKTGTFRTTETKEKIRMSMIGREFSAETREKLSNVNKGKKLSDETKRKLSEINKGKIRKPTTLETKEKISRANLGKKPTEATRKKLSLSKIGTKHNAKLSLQDVHQIRQLLLEGNRGIDIARTFKVTPSTISSIKNKKSWDGV